MNNGHSLPEGDTPDDRVSFADQIRAALNASPLTNQQLATATGLHAGYIWKFRAGSRRTVSLDAAELLMRAISSRLAVFPAQADPIQTDPPTAFE